MCVPICCNPNKILPAIFRQDIPPPAPTRCLSSSPSCGCIPCSAPLQPLSQTVLLRNYSGLEESEHCVITQCDCWNPDGLWRWLLKGEGKLRLLGRLRGSLYLPPSAAPNPLLCDCLWCFSSWQGRLFRGAKIGFFLKAPGAHPALFLLESMPSTYNQVIRLLHLCAMGLWQGSPLTSPPPPSDPGRSNCLI